jgi:hypothetical protein
MLSDTERRLVMTVALRGRFTECELVVALRAAQAMAQDEGAW